MTNLKVVFNKFYDEYVQNTPNKLKIVDAYLVYIVLTGIIQFVYCCLVGSFPFNSFLSGFISTISCFILGGKYTTTLTPLNLLLTLLFASFLQFAFVYKRIHRTKLSFMASHRNEALPTSYWPT